MREMISNRCEPRARSSSLPVARVHRWEDSFILRRLLITRYHPKGGIGDVMDHPCFMLEMGIPRRRVEFVRTGASDRR